VDREEVPGGRTRRVFAKTAPFSTYLLSVVAGAYASVHDEHHGIALGMHARASLMAHLDAPPLFDLSKRLLDYYGDLVPSARSGSSIRPAQFAGRHENVGNITYRQRHL
jgi:aminopeptidase N